MKEITKLFVEEVKDELQALRNMNLGTEEYKITVNGINQFAETIMKFEKAETEREDAAKRLELEKDKFNAESKDKVNRLELDKNKFNADKEDKVERRKMDADKITADSKDREARLELEASRLDADSKDKEARLAFEKYKHKAECEDKEARLDLEKDKFEAEKEDRSSRNDLERDKFEAENKHREEDRVEEIRKNRRDTIDQYVKNGLTAAGIIVPVGMTIWGTYTCLKYDELGHIVTTRIGQAFVNRLTKK